MPVDELIEPNVGVDAVQDNPDPDPAEEDAGYGKNNVDLPEQLQNALKSIIREFQAQEQYDRRREVLRDRRNRFYSRGHQHLWEQTNTGCFAMAVPGGMMQNSAGKSVQCPAYVDDYNIFFPFERTVTSVLTQNPPGIDFRPDNPNLSEDIEAAEVAEGFRQYFDRANDVKELQTAMVRMLLLSGRTVCWTRTEADAQKFGFDPDGKTARSMPTASIYGTLESKVSILAKSQSDCLYLFLSDDPDVKAMKEQYPDATDKIKASEAGIGENAYERIARLGVLQGTRSQAQIGDALTHVTTRMHCWLRPAAFNSDKLEDSFEEAAEGDVNGEGQRMSVKEKLRSLFPLGCHVVFVGETYVGSWAESMDDHIHIDFPYAGDGMHRMAAMDPMVIVQDRFNDDMNAYAEITDHGWPSTWINGEDTDLDSINDQTASPYAFRMRKARQQQAMENEFFREPDPNIPTTIWAKTMFLMGQLAQFILAAPPALFGESMPDQKTASGYAQARSQALGQQGIPWMAVQRMWAKIYFQAAKCALNDPNTAQEIVVPGQNGTNATYQLSKLKGNFGAYPDEDSSFPESTSAKRQQFMQLLQMAAQSPLGAQVFESPDNWALAKSLFGVSELDLPEATSRDKQVAEIEVLLEQDPLPPSQEELAQAQTAHASATVAARLAGQPEPPPFDMMALLKPSVPIDELDFHPWEGKKGQEWLSSQACRQQLAAGNQSGVLNVKLHTKQHLQLAAAMAPPPLPMPVKPHAPPPKGEHGAPNAISAPPGGPGTATM